MDVSIIIVNYNTKEQTKQCINSIIERTKGVTYEIILVDNNSTDGSVELFTADNRVIFIKSNKNLGFGKANNLAFSKTSGKYILLLNSDTLLLNDAITIFYDKMEHAENNIACIGAYLLDKECNPNQSYARFLTTKRLLVLALKSYINRNKCKRKKELWGEHRDWMQVEMIIGADLFIKRTVIKELGLFDNSFFMYHEENDMQRRYSVHGYKMALVLGPQIIHYEQLSSSKFTLMSKKIMSENGMFNYMRIWTSYIEFSIFKFLYILLKIPIIFDKRYSMKDIYLYFKFLYNVKYKRINEEKKNFEYR